MSVMTRVVLAGVGFSLWIMMAIALVFAAAGGGEPVTRPAPYPHPDVVAR